jgi:FkbH-like protein
MTKGEVQRRAAIAVAATFTAEPLQSGLHFVLEAAGLALDVRFAPYNQVFQELLTPTGLLANNTGGVNVVLARVEDFAREAENVEERLAIIERVAPELCSALTQHVHRERVPMLFAALPPSPGARRVLGPKLEAAHAALVAYASSLPGLILLSPEDIDPVSTQERYDDLGDELGHMPFTEEHYAAIALAIARKVHALRVPAQKVLVLDCDETLWRGVVGEDGVEGITIPPDRAQLQHFAVKIQAQGVLICLVSKNSERDVLEVFEKRTDMILGLDHIVAHRINWDSKPRNIASLARALNLGLDSFVFIDDNPVECALMRTELPQVVTLQLPPDNEIESFLSRLWTFDKVTVTDEDTRRTAMYRENATREEFEESATDVAAFIASLGVVVDMAAPVESEWSRLAQLTQRTNQFNFTTVRRTEPEMRALRDSGYLVLRVRVRDRFGDYGIVGLVIATGIEDALVVDTFLLSCRVLGRGVEHAILRQLGEIASKRALRQVHLPYIATDRNEPARAFVESLAAPFRVQEEDSIVYRIPLEAAFAIAHRPGHDPAAVIEARKSEERKSAAPSGGSSVVVERSERYARLAQTLISDTCVLKSVRADSGRVRNLTDATVAPTTDSERALLSLWQELLGIVGLGVEDDYFAVGGTSLIAARLFAEIARRFGTRLPLTTILELPTVRKLANRLEQQRTLQAGALIELRRGGPRNLFLVHDGDGETLLYLNLARRMPDDLAIFGIEPRRIAGVPLAHAAIEEMAAFYLEEVRKKQPHGPYLFGGMCAGGVIAYEMAAQVERAGECVELVALLDAAAPRAIKSRGRITKARLGRLQQALEQARSGGYGLVRRARLLVGAITKKVTNALMWEIAQRGKRWSAQARFTLLREVLARNISWPAFVPELTVRQIYDTAEARYVPNQVSIAPIVLARARLGDGSDTPYRHIYEDETLGWGSLAHNLTVIDVDGGHSSMLQERFVDSLAKALTPYVSPTKAEPIRARRIEATVA